MNPTEFLPLHKDEAFVVGRLKEDLSPGVFLSAEYLYRLGEVLAACKVRLEKQDGAELPDALKNLIGIVEHLLSVHRQYAPPPVANRESVEKVQEELRRALEALNPNGDDDGPRRA